MMHCRQQTLMRNEQLRVVPLHLVVVQLQLQLIVVGMEVDLLQLLVGLLQLLVVPLDLLHLADQRRVLDDPLHVFHLESVVFFLNFPRVQLLSRQFFHHHFGVFGANVLAQFVEVLAHFPLFVGHLAEDDAAELGLLLLELELLLCEGVVEFVDRLLQSLVLIWRCDGNRLID